MNINVQESFEKLIKQAVNVKYSVDDYEITDGVYKCYFDIDGQFIGSPSPQKQYQADELHDIEHIYESQVFVKDKNIDSYKDKSKRKLIDLSFSNRSYSNNTDVGDGQEDEEVNLDESLLSSADEKLMTDSLIELAKGQESQPNSNEETPQKSTKGKKLKFDEEGNKKKKGKTGLGFFFKKLCCMVVDDD